MRNLKRCPFCGGKAHTFHIPENDDQEMNMHPRWKWNNPGMWVVGCDTDMCMVNINIFATVFTSEEAAANAWNKRVPEWIKPQDEKPKDRENVLISTHNGLSGEAEYRAETDLWWLHKKARFLASVGAWQPLPELCWPEEEKC